MNEPNYDRLMTEYLKEHGGETLLLHSCCAPCSSYCLEEVGKIMRTTVFYYNPNLDSEEEYEKRKSEQIRFLKETGLADFLDCDYAHGDFERIAEGFEGEKEGGARCERCFRLRLEKTARTAKEGGYSCFDAHPLPVEERPSFKPSRIRDRGIGRRSLSALRL